MPRFTRPVCALLLWCAVAAPALSDPIRLARAADRNAPDASSAPAASGETLQHTHPLGADPGLGQLRDFLGAGGRMGRLASDAAYDTYNAENYGAAVNRLYVAHVFAPDDAEVLRCLGFAAKSWGRYELAYDALQLAVVYGPDNYTAWWWLGDTQRLLGRYDAALDSMVRAREAAPDSVRAELSGYVDYTRGLANDTPAWEYFDYHREFAKRHETTRRARRAIAEYQRALEVMPEFPAEDTEAWARLGYTCLQMAVQYAYLQEFATAEIYYGRAAQHYRQAQNRPQLVRCLSGMAECYFQRARRGPGQQTALLDEALGYREEAYTLAATLHDLAQQRLTLGRYLETLAERYPAGHERMKELRAQAALELPRSGVVTGYGLVAIALGEAACRLAEEDLGGARLSYLMAVDFLEDSEYLEDTLRLASTQARLAHLYYRQGHHAAAIDAGGDALAAIAKVRSFVHGQALFRSSAWVTLREASGAIVRAAIATDDVQQALAAIEEYKERQLEMVLGGATRDDSHHEDRALEASLAGTRLSELQDDLAAVQVEDNAERVARIQRYISRERTRLERLALHPTYDRRAQLLFEHAAYGGLDTLQTALGPETGLVHYIVDRYGACAVVVHEDGATGVLIEEAGETWVAEAVHALQQAVNSGGEAVEAREALGQRLLAPVADHLGGGRVFVAPDFALHGVPFDMLTVEGEALLEVAAVSHVLSGAHLVHALEAPAAEEKEEEEETVRVRAATDGTEAAVCDPAAPYAQLVIEAPVRVWPENPIESALLLAAGRGFDGRLLWQELLVAKLPARAAFLCLGDGWPARPRDGAVLQALRQAFAYGGTPSLAFNLWGASCTEAAEHFAAHSLTAETLRAWKQEQRKTGAPLAGWGGLVHYGVRPAG
ncbi:MAG: tetratricopeptide repeat protein [Candidatus Hydrogenedentota bacterium]